MRKVSLVIVLMFVGAVLAGCSAPPPLKSDKYLNDRSLVLGEPCAPPCFQGITVGQTTFVDAVSKAKENKLFSNVQSQEKTDQAPAQAAWATVGGESCCQITADPATGLVDAILVRVAPVMTLQEVIAKYGDPAYVSVLSNDYSPTEVAMGLIYPKSGNIIWVMPGDANSTVDENDPVVVVLYLKPESFTQLLDTATLQGWDGYKSYQKYKTNTPALTPRVTLTPKP